MRQFLCIIMMLLPIVFCEYKYQTKWFKVPLDHFSFHGNETFQIKYLENEEFWDRGAGPIFFYTGNEAQVEFFAKYTGFMWDIAPEYKAKIVFAEHRYYGESLPFGNRSVDNDHIGYLTIAQTLADYADLVKFLQGGRVKPRYPVIAFGGSYGGILAAYFRIKYPHLVNGAIAASAPLNMISGMVPCDVFNRILTTTFNIAGTKCVDNIRRSWSIVRSFLTTAHGTDWLHKNWKLCDPVRDSTDVDILIDFLNSMYIILATVNYPYPFDFWVPLPAHPVRVVCQYLRETMTGQKLLEGIGNVLKVFTDYEKKNKCVDYRKGYGHRNLDERAWSYQVCTEMMIPNCATGNNDMFEPFQWSFSEFSEVCHTIYNVYPRETPTKIEFTKTILQAASNIVFSNGLLDPWSGGGILINVSETVKAITLIDVAHHLDLMRSNPADPDTVKTARTIYKDNINLWIDEFHQHNIEKRVEFT